MCRHYELYVQSETVRRYHAPNASVTAGLIDGMASYLNDCLPNNGSFAFVIHLQKVQKVAIDRRLSQCWFERASPARPVRRLFRELTRLLSLCAAGITDAE
jgi:hypothetical protein